MSQLSTGAKGTLITAAGATVLSVEALLVRLVRVDGWTVLFWRGLLMAVGFLIAFSVMSRGRGLLRGLVAAGAAGAVAAAFFALDNLLFIFALRTTSVANTLVIISTVPVHAALLSRLVLGERVQARFWAVIATVLAGVAVIFYGSLGSGHVQGNLAALGAAVSIAAVLVTSRRFPTVSMIPAMALGALLAALAALPFARIWSAGPRDALLLGLLGLVVVPLAFGLIVTGPRYLPAPEVSLLMLLETVLGPLWVWFVLAHRPATSTFIGGSLVLAALVTHSVLGLRRPDRAGTR
jgi:drug/metabolite transporter (DMT)-like permease